ncbi:MAG: hypothetical protein HY238_17075 [Acidobacteria bacterium]|nr:hypothetical protein [Acidobacteriota bacterium]
MPGGPRNGAGRKAVHIDLIQLEKLFGLQCADEELAAWFGLSPSTIARRRRHAEFAEAIERGRARGRISVRRAQMKLLASGNPTIAVWLGRQLLGQRDVITTEHTGSGGEPIQLAPSNPTSLNSPMRNSSSFKALLARPSLPAEIAQELAKRRLLEFVLQAWPVIEPATDFIPGWHLDAICDHLEAVSNGHLRNLLINIPPRHMKSLAVAVFWPAWEWIRWPERRWLFSSYALSLSIRDSVKCRRLIQSAWYRSRWGDRFQLTGDQNAKERFENNKTGYRLATSVGGAATGEGGDRVIVDDPHNVKEAESDTVRQGVIDWWDQVMSTRLNDPKTGAKVIIMQRIHEGDLSGHVLEQGGYEHLCLPAEYEGNKCSTSIGWSDPRQEHGELLWSARFGRQEIEELQHSMGSYAAAGQLQQRPAPAEGGILKRHWWKFYRERPGKFSEVLQSWD